ncbi:4'-phosphopantetheinyl transferase superfamily protein [Streptomyces sp. P9(2023)]|uniref:4'-phosphopantetheinyl transferase family protein n=1 Tax=Streptomyces sp. P9(2023) TaxID=3064394 RepID=UPI0028F43923|nr:4'-phosphopantetheinyl transferase superfamily protein [Streptomyces sp. P9(2023)]MDT9687548.1 4'-phosphopantetheinyl transferase superfamily protein [Streptomyces sp. P9(2023)]
MDPHPVSLTGRASGPGTSAGAADAALLADVTPGVTVAELFTDPPQPYLYPQEAEVVARAVGKRRREFATVRLCARTALAGIGVSPRPIPRGPSGAPAWPAGVVGSMTHCDGYRAAAVARSTSFAAIGIDAEPNLPLPAGVREKVTSAEERESLDRLAAAHPAVAWDRLLFSAKESTYKMWFPLTGRWLDFDECVIVPDPERGTFTSSLRVPGPMVDGRRIDTFTGHWRTLSRHGADHLATMLAVPVGRALRGR